MQRLCSVLALCLLLPLAVWARLDVSGNITENTLWSPTDSVVVINGVVNVNAGVTLTIEPGTVVKFYNTGALLQVYGDLIAQGAPGDTIVFTSYHDDLYGGDTNANGDASQAAPGQWTQIVIRDGDAVDLSYCLIRYAGYRYNIDGGYHSCALRARYRRLNLSNSIIEQTYFHSGNYYGALYIDDGASLSMDHCSIVDNQYRGLFTDAVDSVLVHQCVLRNNGERNQTNATYCEFVDSFVEDNTRDNGYGVVCSGATLYAENTVFSGNGYGLYLQVTDVELNHCVIRYCATRGIELRSPTNLVMHDSRIDSCGPASWALNINGGTLEWESFVDNEIVDNEWWTLQVPLAQLNQLISTNLITGNGNNNALYVTGDTFPTGTTRLTNAFAYCFDGTFTVSQGDSLILDPGVLIKFHDNGDEIDVYGFIDAVGSEAEPIVLTSWTDDSYGGDFDGTPGTAGAFGNWRRMYIANVPSVRLEYCVFRFGGYSNRIMLQLHNSNLVMQHCQLDSAYCGDSNYGSLYASSSVQMDVEDCAFTGNQHTAILNLGSYCNMRRNRFVSNGRFGIDNRGSYVLVDSCSFESNASYGFYNTGSYNNVTRNTFSDNGNYAIYATGTDVAINTNTVEDNYRGVACYTTGDYRQFLGNSITGSEDWGIAVNGENLTDAFISNSITDNGYNNGVYINGGRLYESLFLPASRPYVIDDRLGIDGEATLSLEPGTVLKFRDGDARLDVFGTLLAEGTAQDSIIFTYYTDDAYGVDVDGTQNTSGSPGNWEQISFYTSTGSSMDYCRVRYAGNIAPCSGCGSGGYNAISLINSSLNLDHSIIEQTSTTSSSSYLRGAIYTNSNSVLDMRNSLVDGITGYVGILNYATEAIFENVEISNTASHGMLNYGSETSMNLLHAHNNGADGIYSNAAAVVITNCLSEDNGGWGFELHSADVVFTDNVSRTNTYGIHSQVTGDDRVLERNQLLDNSNWGVSVNGENLPAVFTNNTFSGNGQGNGIRIVGGTLYESIFLPAVYPYDIDAQVTVHADATLSLEPGCVVKFNDGDSMLEIQGSLMAEGTAQDSIVFTYINDDDYGFDLDGTQNTSGSPGNWENLYFYNSESSVMQYCVVRYAGNYCSRNSAYTGIFCNNSALTLANSRIEHISTTTNTSYNRGAVLSSGSREFAFRDSEVYDVRSGESVRCQSTAVTLEGLWVHEGQSNGLYVSGANCVIRDNTVEDNSGVGIYVQGAGCWIDNNRSFDNGNYGLYITAVAQQVEDNELSGNSVSPGYRVPLANAAETAAFNLEEGLPLQQISVDAGTLTEDAIWRGGVSYWIQGNVTVQSGVTLSLSPGTVIKAGGNTQMIVSGNLVADGSLSDQIVFTSYLDDNYGGDTNGDGDNTTPAVGNWRGLRFNNCGSETVFRNTVVRYAGDDNYSAIDLNDCSFDIENAIIVNNRYIGVYASQTTVTHLSDCDIYGNDNLGVSAHTSISQPVDARNCWWGDPSGPSHSSNPAGLGEDISDNVLWDPAKSQPHDNPWYTLQGPDPSGIYKDAVVLDVDQDELPDLIAGTSGSGLRLFVRSGFETWNAGVAITASGTVQRIRLHDFDDDGIEDLLCATDTGIQIWRCNGDGTFSALEAPATTSSYSDIRLAWINGDAWPDIVGISRTGVRYEIFLGSPTGEWTAAAAPSSSNTLRSISVGNINGDAWLDLVATTENNNGIEVWLGQEDGSWQQGDRPVSVGMYYGMDLGDINGDGLADIAAASLNAGGQIEVMLNDSGNGWITSSAPTSSGRYNDLVLQDMNGDGSLDLIAASQTAGVQAWAGAGGLTWRYWYHPSTTGAYERVFAGDFTLDNSPDILAAGNGLAMWGNRSVILPTGELTFSPQIVSFGQVLLGVEIQRHVTLHNATADSVRNILMYSSSGEFSLELPTGMSNPFAMAPGDSVAASVTYLPVEAGQQNEAVIVRTALEVLYVPLTATGVTQGIPVWEMSLQVQNGSGGVDGTTTLSFGAGPGARAGLDVPYAETELPPLPPQSVFDVRWLIDSSEGSLRDYRDSETQEHVYHIKVQPGNGGWPVTVSWDPLLLPNGFFTISDPLGGVLIPEQDMALSSSIELPEVYGLDELVIHVTPYFPFGWSLAGGWNLIALPVTPNQSHVDSLFENHTAAWFWDDGYQALNANLSGGVGYWLEMPTTATVQTEGLTINSVELSLDQGWHLVGGPGSVVDLSAVTQNPSNSLSAMYGFQGQYTVESSFEPGHAYWLKAEQACNIVIESALRSEQKSSRSPIKRQPAVVATREEPEFLLPLSVCTMDNLCFELAFGQDHDASVDLDPELDEAELPPLPPSSVCDLRWRITAEAGSLRDLRPLGDQEYVLEIQPGTNSTLEFSWDPGMLIGYTAVIHDALDAGWIDIDMSTMDHLSLEGQALAAGSIRITLSNTTGVEQSLPLTFALGQNYPNPFNGVTVIPYQLPRDSEVNLSVYNLLGERVEVLVSGRMPAGYHEFQWQSENRGLASGMYIVVMQAEEFRAVRKVALIK